MKSHTRDTIRRFRRTAAGLLLASLPGVAFAQGSPAVPSGLTDAEASGIALARVHGTVVRVEREDERGRHIVEVHVRDARGRVMGVEIDDATRRIVRVEREEADESAEDEDGAPR